MYSTQKVFSSPYQNKFELNEIYRGTARTMTECRLRCEIKRTTDKIINLLDDYDTLMANEKMLTSLVSYLGVVLDILDKAHKLKAIPQHDNPRLQINFYYKWTAEHIFDPANNKYLKSFYIAYLRHEIKRKLYV